MGELQQRKGSVFPDESLLPPVGVIPLGTGNDLARSLGWGAALTDMNALQTYIRRAVFAESALLDQWKLTLRAKHVLPPVLRAREDQEFVGFFTNYFLVGMDARTAYEVGRARQGGIGAWCFRLRCCWPCKFMHGGFFCYGVNAPNPFRCCCCRRRPLNEDLEVHMDSASEPLMFPNEGVQQFTVTNLNSYGAGMSVFSSQEFRDQVSPVDWKLEAFTKNDGKSLVSMTLAKKIIKAPCHNTPIMCQPGRVELRLRKGEHFQLDGEPWLLNSGCTAVIEPYARVHMICPVEHGPGAGAWGRAHKRSFWSAAIDPARQRKYGW